MDIDVVEFNKSCIIESFMKENKENYVKYISSKAMIDAIAPEDTSL